MITRAILPPVLVLTFCSVAQADFTVSKKATHDVSCVSGVCTPTAKGANLNVSELTTLLADGDTVVKTGGGAITIQVLDGFSWTSASRLTLDANHSVGFHEPLTIVGRGALSITYNDGGSGGDLLFFDRGRIVFGDTRSNLKINDQRYALVNSIADLVAKIAAQPPGHFALANNYDASADGPYSDAPITAPFPGIFEGLGNAIQNFSIKTPSSGTGTGLFSGIGFSGMCGMCESKMPVLKSDSIFALLSRYWPGSTKVSFRTSPCLAPFRLLSPRQVLTRWWAV